VAFTQTTFTTVSCGTNAGGDFHASTLQQIRFKNIGDLPAWIGYASNTGTFGAGGSMQIDPGEMWPPILLPANTFLYFIGITDTNGAGGTILQAWIDS
jgi:hypothetical protein